jgi:hypothetical protein
MSRVVVIGATGHVGTYRPRYSSLDALRESLRWLAANGHVDLGDQEL